MTPLQFAMLKTIARNYHTPVNGAEPKTIDDVSWVWADCVIENAEDKGVFTSLVNAGFAQHSGHKGRDACVTLTQTGFDAYKAYSTLTTFARIIRGEEPEWTGDRRLNAEAFLLAARNERPLAACTMGHNIEENVKQWSDITGLPFRTLHQAANLLTTRVNTL